jgi:hypothetical protein
MFCPDEQGQIIYANGWTGIETPDYFNSCQISCSFPTNCIGVPTNFFGYQPAYEGSAYVGIVTFRTDLPNWREYINIQLISPLTIGVRYYASAHIARANNPGLAGATNNFGFQFFTTLTSLAPNPNNNFSHINDVTLATDSVSWTKVSGSFIADSSYNFVSF